MVIDKHAPIKLMRDSENNCPWMNNDLKGLIKERDKLKKAAVKRKSPILMDSYKT